MNNSKDDLISRSALLADLAASHYWAAEWVYNMVRDAPAVDAEPVVNGNWILDDYGSHCDVCGYMVPDYNRSKYCPKCGAKMDFECEA